MRKKKSKIEKQVKTPDKVYPLGPPGSHLRHATNFFYSMAKTLGISTWEDGYELSQYKARKSGGGYNNSNDQ